MSQPRKDHMQRIRLDEQTNALLERLAAAYEGNRSACVRQLIRQAAGAKGSYHDLQTSANPPDRQPARLERGAVPG